MTELEKTKKEIEVLTKKLSFLEELEKTKSPVEEAYKDWWGEYPETGTWDSFDDKRWQGFQAGYNFAQRDYKVGEYQEKEEPKESKTLYQMFYDNKWTARSCDEFCNIVKEWMSQYDCETNKWDEDYKCGFLDCIDVLRKNLK